MDVFALTAENVSAFYPLLPEDVREPNTEEGIVLLGAAAPDEDGSLRACGTAVLQMVDEDTWFVTWLLVAPEYRGQGAGTGLLTLAAEIADAMEMQLYTVFSEAPEAKQDGSLYRLFARCGFSLQPREARSYTTSVGRMGEEPFFRPQKGGAGFTTLTNTPERLIAALNRTLAERGQLLAGPISRETALSDISVTYTEDDRITACAIFTPLGGDGVSLSFVYAHSSASARMPGLLRQAYQLLSRQYPAETEVVIPCVTDTSRRLVEKLLPSAAVSLVTYSAQYDRGAAENR